MPGRVLLGRSRQVRINALMSRRQETPGPPDTAVRQGSQRPGGEAGADGSGGQMRFSRGSTPAGTHRLY